VDIYETDDEYVLNAEVPGVEEKDLRIEIAGSELRIRGERRFDAVCSEESYHRLEGIRGRFQRTFSLPEPLDQRSVRAELKDGLLEVTLPKARS
jgi:HSP20 family protein